MLITVLLVVFGLVSAVVAVVASINIMHVFLLIVAERRREIGLMRMVGATRGDVRALLLGQALLSGLAAGSAGVLLGLLVCRLGDLAAQRLLPPFPYKPDSLFLLSPALLCGALAMSMLCCGLGALLPAIRAARLDPARALTS